MDVKNKKTILDDSAGIYQKREAKTEKQKFSELHGRDKWQYFKDYYFKKMIALIICIIFVIYFVHSIWQSKKHNNIFYAAAIDQYFSSDVITQLENSFGEYIGKTSEYDTISFDASYYFNSYDYASMEKIQALVAAGDIDVLIAKESLFAKYTSGGVMQPLNDCLPTDLVSDLKNNFYLGMITEDTDASGNDLYGPSEAYGIYVDETLLFKDVLISDERVILGIIVSSKNKENAVEFIRFIFNEFVPETVIE